MRHLLLVAVALWTGAVWAQESYHSPDPDLLVRLSYKSSLMASDSIRQICIEVSQQGDYRILSSMSEADGPSGLEGKMSQDQLQALKTLLAESAFRSLAGNHAGIIRNYAERFVAEVSRVDLPAAFQVGPETPSGSPSKPGPPRWLQWLNADGENPFPAPMAKIIRWMKAFETKNPKQLEDPELANVCPSVGLSFVDPSMATNQRP